MRIFRAVLKRWFGMTRSPAGLLLILYHPDCENIHNRGRVALYPFGFWALRAAYRVAVASIKQITQLSFPRIGWGLLRRRKPVNQVSS